MTWLPDWDKPTFTVEIKTDNDEDHVIDVEVTQEGSQLFRIMDIPYCESEKFRWGDLIKATPQYTLGDKSQPPDSIEFLEIIERAEHEFTHGGFLSGKRHAGLILDAIMEAGGFWADDNMMQQFDVIVPPGFDVDKWEADNQDLINSNDSEDTDYDRWRQFMAERRSKTREWFEKKFTGSEITKSDRIKKPIRNSNPLAKAFKNAKKE